MERAEAVERITKLIGKDLRPMAQDYGITVWAWNEALQKKCKNKGWAGHVLERYLGLPMNSSRAPNFGSWELKQTSLKRLKAGMLAVKETIAITMIDPVEVAEKPFRESHLYSKLVKALVVARLFDSQEDDHAVVHSVTEFDLDDPRILAMVEGDYESIRSMIRSHGFEGLSGHMGTLIQPRTKGSAHSTSRAFYARTTFVAHIINSSKLRLAEPVRQDVILDPGEQVPD